MGILIGATILVAIALIAATVQTIVIEFKESGK